MDIRRRLQALACLAALLVASVVVAGQEAERAHGLVIVDRAGNQTVIGEVPGDTWGPRISPDGTKLTFTRTGRAREAGDDTLWVGPLMKPAEIREIGPGRNALWSHDGRRIFYQKLGAEILMWRTPERSDPEQLLDPVRAPESYSKDGRLLSYVQSVDNRFSGWVLELATRRRTPLLDAGPESLGTDISPDGRWVAYQSTKTGRYEVWVQPISGSGPAVQISTQGGLRPLWSNDMRELYFDDGNRQLFAVPIRTQPTFGVAGPTVPLPIKGFVQGGIGRRQYDLLTDGRFLVMLPR